MSKNGSYGVAYPNLENWWRTARTVNNMHEFSLVRACSSKVEAIETACKMNEYMHGKAVPFENLSMRTEVNWRNITEHEIVV